MDSASQRDPGRERPVLDTNKPAVGVAAGQLGRDTLARVAFRAFVDGYTVLLAYEDRDDIEGVDILESVGVIPVQSSVDSPGTFPLGPLKEAAQTYGFAGLIYHDGTEPIDYERTTERFESNGYVTRAAVEAESRESHVETIAAIPAYNEASTIESVVRETAKHVDRVIVVDDGSDDDTVARAEAAGAAVVEHSGNRGYGAALKTAFRSAAETDAERLVILDGDGQHDPEDIPDLFETQRRSDAEVVVGSRFLADSGTTMPVYRRVGLGTVNVLTNLSLGVIRRESWVNDTQSGFRVYGREAIETLAQDDKIGDHMEASTDILYHAHHHDHDITEVGVEIEYDVDGASSHHPLVHGVVLVRNILQTIERERPITLIGLPGFVVVVVGLVLGYRSVANLIATGTVAFVPAVLGAVLVLIGLLTCFTSLVLHSINTHMAPLEPRRRGGSGSG